MKGKGYLFEIAAIGYLRNDEGDVTETNIIYPITTILAKDFESAKFELIRKLSDKTIEEYGSDNIELIVRSFNNTVRFGNTPSWATNGTTITGCATTTGTLNGATITVSGNPNSLTF